jgi:glycerophosphoryl diester phosphodiesterase
VDLKLPGYEREVVDGLAERGLAERALISSTYIESLELVGELAPGLRRGWSFPRARRDYTESALMKLPAYAVLAYWKLRLPGWASAALRRGACEGLMAHRLTVTPRLVRAVHNEGGQLYVWTVDRAERIRRLEALGVDGVITNDPRLFDAMVSPT